MNKIVYALLVSLALIAPASAADLGGKYTPDTVQPIKNAFEGFGIGVHGGIAATAIDINNPYPGGPEDILDGISADGLFAGAHAEYLFASTQRFRIGFYGEGGFSTEAVELLGKDVLTKDSYYGGGLQAGYLPTQFSMIFVRAGYEWQNWTVDTTAFGGNETDGTVGMFVLGTGVRTLLTEHVDIGAGFDYLRLNDADFGDTGGIDLNDVVGETEGYRGMVRLTYTFN